MFQTFTDRILCFRRRISAKTRCGISNSPTTRTARLGLRLSDLRVLVVQHLRHFGTVVFFALGSEQLELHSNQACLYLHGHALVSAHVLVVTLQQFLSNGQIRHHNQSDEVRRAATEKAEMMTLMMPFASSSSTLAVSASLQTCFSPTSPCPAS